MVKFRIRPDLNRNMKTFGLNVTIEMVKLRGRIFYFQEFSSGKWEIIGPREISQWGWAESWLIPVDEIDIVSVFRNRFLELK